MVSKVMMWCRNLDLFEYEENQQSMDTGKFQSTAHKRKRDEKMNRKQESKVYNLTKQQTNDSILKMSVKNESSLNNKSQNSSMNRKTRGLGKKTIMKQSTMANDP